MTLDPKTPSEIIQEQAKQLGGGWRMEKGGLMPIVVLTTDEAAALIQKLNRKSPHDGLLAVRYLDNDDKIYVLPPDRVEFIYGTDGI
jgi:hypothetical protein